MKDEKNIQKEVRSKVDDFMRNYMGESLEAQKNDNSNFGAMSLVDSWFNPEPQLIKHLIIIPMTCKK